jgi:hypothetical protein
MSQLSSYLVSGRCENNPKKSKRGSVPTTNWLVWANKNNNTIIFLNQKDQFTLIFISIRTSQEIMSSKQFANNNKKLNRRETTVG